MTLDNRTRPNPLLEWLRKHRLAVTLALVAAALGLALWSADPLSFPVWVNDGVYDVPAQPATQHCRNTGTTATNDPTVDLWDCDQIKSVTSPSGVVQCVLVKDDVTVDSPYVYCSSTGSASGPSGTGHVLHPRPSDATSH